MFPACSGISLSENIRNAFRKLLEGFEVPVPDLELSLSPGLDRVKQESHLAAGYLVRRTSFLGL